MEATIMTPRLKLTIMERAERGSQELEWLHEMKSDEQCQKWRYALFLFRSRALP